MAADSLLLLFFQLLLSYAEINEFSATTSKGQKNPLKDCQPTKRKSKSWPLLVQYSLEFRSICHQRYTSWGIHSYLCMYICVYAHMHECIVHTYILVRCLLAKLFFSVRLSLLMLRRCYRIYYANFGTQSPLPLLYKKVKLRRNSSRVGWAAPFSIVYLFYDVHVVDFYFIRPSCRLSIFF